MSIAGKRIVVTRTREQASELASLLEVAGAKTILLPTIAIAPPASFCALDAALASLRSFDWAIFTSANAVQAFAARARKLGIMASPRRVAVIGTVTGRAAEDAGLRVDLMPDRAVAESLAEILLPHCGGASMLLVRAEEGRAILPDTLHQAGAQVTVAPAYRNTLPKESKTLIRELFAAGAIPLDAVTFTSSSTATNLFQLLEDAGLQLPPATVLASIGPVTSQTLYELGHAPHVEAKQATVSALASALVDYFAEQALVRTPGLVPGVA